jgi:hypothetical protein
MSIFLSSNVDITNSETLNILGDFGDAVGIPGFSSPNSTRKASSNIEALAKDLNNVVNRLAGKNQEEQFESNFVGDGFQNIGKGVISQKSPLQESNTRKIYSQSANFSVIIKKRAFSSLRNLYNVSLMDPTEHWLLRSIKQLTANKCAEFANWERLSKIKNLEERGVGPGAILNSLITSLLDESGSNFFSSAMRLQRNALLKRPAEITTYFLNPLTPNVLELGQGNGTFELTGITNLQTSLGLDGEGSFSLVIEDPYQILIVDENDIENAINDTALTTFVNVVSSAASLALDSSQKKDNELSKLRKQRGRSEISFTIGVGGKSNPIAIIDEIGFEINENNVDDVEEPYSLSIQEKEIFKSVLSNLKLYQFAMNNELKNGLNGVNAKSIKNQIINVRRKMRLFHLGKSIIQPMDSVNIYIDGGTRKFGETGDVNPGDQFNFESASGVLNVLGNIAGLQDEAQIDEDLLKVEYEREAEDFMRFDDFKKLRMTQISGDGGIHVFGGLVTKVVDDFSSDTGKFMLNVSGSSNMEWLKISRFNSQPSLDQTFGIVYDPLTAFDYETDPATGLPIGKPRLSEENMKNITNGSVYFSTGKKAGTPLKNINDMKQDLRNVGGNIVQLYQHAPGLIYKWKEGIATSTYNLSSTNSSDGTYINYKQLVREVGQFSSHTPFDNMDSANIISILVTGFPYDPSRFVQSALNSGSFTTDSTYNDFRHYFHTFLDVQKSLNFVHGGFVPFKTLYVSPEELLSTVRLQQNLSKRSSRLQQLRTQLAQQNDKISVLKDAQNNLIVDEMQSKSVKLQYQINYLEDEILGLTENGEYLSNLSVAGNDITYDFTGKGDSKEYKLFGDKLTHATIRKRENVVQNLDENLLIISDEYDKDYDIQSFVLKLKQQTPLWKSGDTWQSVHELCKTVAGFLNFEFFVDTQGHIVFRPPQYNRTPASVFSSMFSINNRMGVKLFPEFLSKLFEGREQNLIKDIEVIEWEIRLKCALLGLSSIQQAERVASSTGAEVMFLTNQKNRISEIVKNANAVSQYEKEQMLNFLKKSNSSFQLSNSTGGAFNPLSQGELQKSVVSNLGQVNGAEEAYNNARKALSRLKGMRPQSIPEFNAAKIGVSRNGNKTPETDTNKIISDISVLVSQRARLLITLEKVLDQSAQIAQVDNNGSLNIGFFSFSNDDNFNKKRTLFDKLIEDDGKHILGHMSGERFIIRDEHILRSSFSESPPNITNVTVTGTDPLVGEGGGNLANTPVYVAYGVDFDMWRQYGWRSEKSFNQPFFWSAELQCAPYAIMLLSRQRKNIVTGTITVMGNEFYQLGDVVYVTHRNMLYYVDKISHQLHYDGVFDTTLTLTYGHSPGEYIPTPLDIIGKGLISASGVNNSYRTVRDRPISDTYLTTIKFDDGSSDILNGENATRNFSQLTNAVLTAKTDINFLNPLDGSNIFILTFGGDKSLQKTRANAIKNWFLNPRKPGESNSFGKISTTSNNKDTTKIPPNVIQTKHINQDVDFEKLTASEKQLLREGFIADQRTIMMDRSLKNVVEIRLKQPPQNGWKKSGNNTQ